MRSFLQEAIRDFCAFCDMMEKIRTFKTLAFLCGLHLPRDISFLGASTGILTSRQSRFQSHPFPWKLGTHLHLHPPAHLSFKPHKPGRLF